ncbi:hypothetical protein SFUMM280S_05550 [Streptomyces fumanus]
MSGAEGGGGGRCFLRRLPTTSPPSAADHDHGDDYSKDEDVHNPSSIGHEPPAHPVRDAAGGRKRGDRTTAVRRTARLVGRAGQCAGGVEERAAGLARLLEYGCPRGARAQPISSRALPFVSFTNFRTNGMESAAKIV